MRTLFVLALLLSASFSVRADDVPAPQDYLEVQYGYIANPPIDSPVFVESWGLHEENGVFTGSIFYFLNEQFGFPGALPDPSGGYFSQIYTIEEFVPASAGCAALVNGPLVCDMQALGIPLTFATGFDPSQMPYDNIVQADYNTLLAEDPVSTPEPPEWTMLLALAAFGALLAVMGRAKGRKTYKVLTLAEQAKLYAKYEHTGVLGQRERCDSPICWCKRLQPKEQP